MPATLVLRTVKGSPLTNLEVDNNFSNLNVFSELVNSNIGLLASLTTQNKSNVVVAINEIILSTNRINSNVGVLSNLTTTANGNIVSALNEGLRTTIDSSVAFAIALG